jgi:hypothetical protein
MDLKTAIEVREASDASAPENSIEIVTPNRTYLLAAEDEDEQIRWVDALADKLEERKVAIKRENSDGSANGNISADVDSATRKEAIKGTIVYGGELSKRTVNPIAAVVMWQDRYFVIANGTFSEFFVFS